jgi:hypothetical protein
MFPLFMLTLVYYFKSLFEYVRSIIRIESPNITQYAYLI